jgi:hypothetical protein
MLAYSTNQTRASGFRQAPEQFSAPKPAGNSHLSTFFSNAPAQQQQAPFGQFSQAQVHPSNQRRSNAPQSGHVAPAQSQPSAAAALPVPQHQFMAAWQPTTQPPSLGSAATVFQGFNPSNSQVAQAAPFDFKPQPVAAVAAYGAPLAQRAPPRAAMTPKIAAAVSPALSLNCRQGHGLVCISGKPARYSDWFCDLCRQKIPDDTKHVMHCDKCASDGPVAPGTVNGFDICPACRAKARDAMSVWPLILNAASCPMFPGLGDYWQTLYCHRQQAPFMSAPSYYPMCCPQPLPRLTLAPCGPREGEQCLDCKRGQDALVASVEGKLLNRGGRAVSHVCYGTCAGRYFCSECAAGGQQCADCNFTQENLPDLK